MSMTDREIVERLRYGRTEPVAGQPNFAKRLQPTQDELEAANAIERLTKERDEAIEALRELRRTTWDSDNILRAPGISKALEDARSILSKHEVKNDSN